MKLIKLKQCLVTGAPWGTIYVNELAIQTIHQLKDQPVFIGLVGGEDSYMYVLGTLEEVIKLLVGE